MQTDIKSPSYLELPQLCHNSTIKVPTLDSGAQCFPYHLMLNIFVLIKIFDVKMTFKSHRYLHYVNKVVK